MADISHTKPYLSTDTFFFSQDGGRYLFAPLTRTYARINEDMEALLRYCDGTQSVAEIIDRRELTSEAIDLFRVLFAKGIVSLEAKGVCVAAGVELENAVRPFTHLTLFPTHACNLTCTYCYASGGDRTSSMAWYTAQAAFDFFFDQLPDEQELVALSFHGGGEPTLAFPFIKEVAAEFSRRCEELNRRYHVSMVTNGTFGPDVLDWIVKENIGINFSLDGPPVIQDRQRPFRNGSGSYNTVVENIRRLREADREITVRATVTSESLAHLDELVYDCLELEVAALQAEPCFAVGRCRETGTSEPDPEGFAQRFLEAYRLGLAHDMNVTYSGFRCTDTPRDRFCGACGDSVAVTPEGYLTTCFEVVHADDPAASIFFVGSVDQSTGQVWLDQDRLAYLRSRITPNLPRCTDCFLKYNCAGDCVVKSFRSSGNIFARVPKRCQMAEIINKKVICWIADGNIVPRNEDSFDQYLY